MRPATKHDVRRFFRLSATAPRPLFRAVATAAVVGAVLGASAAGAVETPVRVQPPRPISAGAKGSGIDAMLAALPSEPTVATGLPLTKEALTGRIESLRSSATVPAEARERAIADYQVAVENLTAADSLERKADAFEHARVDAPRTLAELTRELNRPPSEPAPEQAQPLTELETTLSMVQADLAAARTTLLKVEGEQNKRSRRRIEAPQQVAAAKAELAEIQNRLRAVSEASTDEAALAQRAALLSRHALLEATLRVCDREIASYDARGELLSAKRDQALRRVARLTERADDLQEKVATARAAAAERDASNARAARRQIAAIHPQLEVVANRNAELAALRSGDDGLTARIHAAGAKLQKIRDELGHLQARFAAAREKAEAVGFTPAVGLLLRKERAELPSIPEHQRAVRARRGEIGNVQLHVIELEEERDRLADIEHAKQQLMGEVELVLAASRIHVIANTARELLLTQSGYLEALIQDYDRYFTTLVELDAREEDLVATARTFGNYIDENILWIRGPSILNTRMAAGVRSTVAWASRPLHLALLVDGVHATLTSRPASALVLMVLWGCIFIYRRRIRARLEELCPGHAASITIPVIRTAEALLLTATLAAIWPLLIVLGAVLLDSVEGASGELGTAIASGMITVAEAFFVAELLRRLCRAGGVFETHFAWPRRRARAVRHALASAMAVGLPALLVVTALDQQPNDLFKNSLGRIAFMVGMTWVGVAVYRMMHPRSGLFDGRAPRVEGPWREQLLRAAHAVVIMIPAVLVVMASLGYDYAAHSVQHKLGQSIVFGFIVYLSYAMVTRWLLVARRELMLRQAAERKAAHQQAEETRDPDADVVVVTEADLIDLGAINDQTRRLVRTATAAAVLVAFWLIWHDVLPAFRVFERVELWQVTEHVTESVPGDGAAQTRTVMQQRPITLLDALAALVIALLAFVAGTNIPGFLEIAVLRRLPFDAGIRYAVTTLCRYLIAVIGSVLAVNALGLGWSQVQWLVAAMTVGLGFGLQEIFANFVAGIIVLFERPVRVGDVVTLGDLSGTVARIRIRATTIIDWDRKELIIPNKEFITGQLINWTLSDQILRVVVPVGIAYGSDTRLAERLLLEIAERCEYVMKEPPPTVLFSGFGESSLDFQLRVHIAQFDHMWLTRHALCMAIDTEFRKAGLEIAFPQRDLHIRSIAGPIELSMRTGGEASSVTQPHNGGR